MIGVTLNSFNSMFFMIIITRINGTDNAGVFTLLFSVANLLYNIGVYAGRTFQVTDNTGKYTDSEYVIHRTLTVSVMFIVGALYCAIKGFTVYKFALTMLLTLMKCIEAYSDSLYGVLQKNDELYKSGISLTVKALCSLVLLFIVDLVFRDLIIGFIIVDIVCFVITLVYDIPNAKKYLNKDYSIKKSLGLFGAGAFAFAYYFLNVYLANAPKYALDGKVLDSEQALFSIILMPATLINLCAIYMLQPYINRLGLLYSENRYADFKKSMRIIVLGIFGIGTVAFICATFLGVPVLNIVYGVDLTDYLTSLQIIIFGATLAAIVTVLSTALTVFRNTRDQFLIYCIVSGIIFAISSLLVDTFGVYGGAYVYLSSTLLQIGLYLFVYLLYMKKWKKLLEEEKK